VTSYPAARGNMLGKSNAIVAYCAAVIVAGSTPLRPRGCSTLEIRFTNGARLERRPSIDGRAVSPM